MISEGSRDTEDWRDAAENTALYHGNTFHVKYIQMENHYLKLCYYFTILLFYCIFDQINAAW